MKFLTNKGNYFTALSVIALLTLYASLAEAADISNSQESTTTTFNTQDRTAKIGTAQDWGLTTEEWNRYLQLMQGANGLWYPQLTPPAVLGLNADTVEEQKHFARIVAKQEHEKVARELVFNNMVFTAMRSLYPDEPMIQDFDKTSFNPGKAKASKTTILQAGDRLALFVDPQQGKEITLLPKLLALIQMNANISLEIYCLGKSDDMAISAWAALNQIPADLVKTRRITLHHDSGKLATTAGQVSVPYLLLSSNGQTRPVSIADL